MNKEKKLLVLSIIVIIVVSGFILYNLSQKTPVWQKIYKGPDNETGHSVINAFKGGYLALGNKEISGDTDVYLLRVNALGNQTWETTLGGPGDDYGYSLRQSLARKYIFVGKTSSYGAGGYDAWFVNVEEDGTPSFNVTYGGSGDDAAYSFKQTKDSRYIITGKTSSFGSVLGDVYLLKVNPNGVMQWQKSFGGPGTDWGKSVLQSENANYWVLGSTNSYGYGGYDFYLVETNPEGSLVLSKTFGGTGDDFGDTIVENIDGSFILTGKTNSSGKGSFDALIIKIDSYGNQTWNKTFGGSGNESATFSRETDDRGFLIIGDTTSYGAGGSDIFVLKTDYEGNVEWNKTFGGPGNDYASFILETFDRGYLLIGTTIPPKNGTRDIMMIKMDLKGNTVPL